ncbi:MAG: type II toxin-antitoxin system Phd/YefM family antitoxin [Thermoguttaceae bacterium]
MKLIGLKEAKTNLSAFVEESQHQRILITRRGRPAALVIGVEGRDLEELLLAGDIEFWGMIQERRRRGATLTSAEIRRSFGIEAPAAREAASRPRRPRGGRRAAGGNRE